jgi:hypothetical protein
MFCDVLPVEEMFATLSGAVGCSEATCRACEHSQML